MRQCVSLDARSEFPQDRPGERRAAAAWRAPIPNPVEAAVWAMNYYLGKNSRSLRRHERRPSNTHTAAPVSWGRGPSPSKLYLCTLGGGGKYRPVGRRVFYCSRAVQRRRVESLVLGALSSSPVHRALVLVLGTNIAVLLNCSKSSRQCSLTYLLTYLWSGQLDLRIGPLHRETAWLGVGLRAD